MTRRDFLTLVGGAATWPLAAALSQQPRPTIGFLTLQSRDAAAFQTAAFRKGLSEAGFDEGNNIEIHYKWGNNRVDPLPALAADLVRREVRAIAAFSTVASRVAKA